VFCGESNDPRGIDRWDNSIGYEEFNCLPCCGVCNRMKSARVASEFIEHTHRMSKHMKNSDVIANMLLAKSNTLNELE
jgi:uncharacterized protein YuzB (UPF0349 family)